MPRTKKTPTRQAFIKQEPELIISDDFFEAEDDHSDITEDQYIKQEPDESYEIFFLDDDCPEAYEEDNHDGCEYFINADFVEPEVILTNEEEYNLKRMQEVIAKASKDLAWYTEGLQSDLEESEAAEAVTPKQFYCAYCGQSFISSMARYRHFKTHTDFHRCTLCRKMFHKKHHLKNHMKIHDRNVKIMEQYLPKFKLPKNTSKSSGCNKRQLLKLLQCEMCNKWYRSKITLHRHQLTQHPHTQFTCDICGETFGTNRFREIHYQKVHSLGQYQANGSPLDGGEVTSNSRRNCRTENQREQQAERVNSSAFSGTKKADKWKWIGTEKSRTRRK
ncbi:PR domain zinc finger protein 5-like [Uranotaenia lowii]|uniref:PR domain zinc finger protein 5-like n=1 Tax=Uranotaenia lowii TaxID=190385 RepID=UPI0024796C66|nr:PR domain zinc finger protein 5-like [Uranotaenia lowii]